MRIVVISLLRLGDVMMAAPAILGLRNKYPKAHISLVVNKSSAQLKKLMPYVNEFIEFDRDEIQHGLVKVERPIFESYERLKKFIGELNQNPFDIAINLTQNKLSGYLMGLIQSNEKIGLTIDDKGMSHFYSPWFKHLNDVIEASAESVFHYTDVFYYGSGLERGLQNFSFSETAAGQEELLDFLRHNGFNSQPKIVVQALTSDTKKNWGLQNWVAMLKLFQTFEPQVQIILLGAPAEKAQLNQLVEKLRDVQVDARLAIMSLEGALSLFQVSDLLITGDTSIKHLAAGTGIATIELALGSSHLYKTGAYQTDALILTSREECSPCSHKVICHRKSHACAESIEPELVALAASKRIHSDWAAIETLANEYSDRAKFYRTKKLLTGVWYADPISKFSTHEALAKQLDLAAWQFYLESEYLKPLAAYGSEGLKLKNQLQLILGEFDLAQFNVILNQFESNALKCEMRLNKLIANLSRDLPYFTSPQNQYFFSAHIKEEIIEIEKELKLGHFLSEKINETKEQSFFNVRQLQSSLNTAFIHQQIKIKLLRSLKSQMREMQ